MTTTYTDTQAPTRTPVRRRHGRPSGPTMVVVALVIIMLVVLLTGCDPTFKSLEEYGGGRWRCDQPVYLLIGPDFTEGQFWDILSAANEVRDATRIDLQPRFDIASNNRPANSVLITKELVLAPGGWYPTGYSWPGNDGAGNAQYGFVKISPRADWLLAPTAPSSTSGYVWRGLLLHEMMHAVASVADLYTDGDGHPELIMGNGYFTRSTLATGDLNGAKARGCW